MTALQIRVTSIVFDLTTDDDDMSSQEMDILQKELQEKYINRVYDVDDESNLDFDDECDRIVDAISDETGWCILSSTFSSNKEYELQFFAIDDEGDVVSVTEGYFISIADAEERLNNIGSKWILYPNARICVDGDVIKEYLAE